ncbi:MAG TPA: hypothetical protein VHY75_11870 [Steroidobacteraceae bacterium]|nr:hypothetical protein [Steroidobacteraceae bacterium]
MHRSRNGARLGDAPKHWLVLGAALCALSALGQAPAPGQPSGQSSGQQAPRQASPPPPATVPDEEFIEFLGEDDHGDSAWWEFLKRTPPGSPDPAPPPQSPKQ